MHIPSMTVRQFFSVVEIRTKVVSVSTYLIASLYVVLASGRLDLSTAILLGVAVLAVDMGTTAFNSFYDFARGVDVPGLTVEPDKVLVHEGVAPGAALIVSIVLYIIAAVTGAILAFQSTWWLIPVGVVSMAVGFLYNGGPLPISTTPVGELFAGGFLGSVLFLVIVLAHKGTVSGVDLLYSVPSTLMIAAVLTVNNNCDVEGDREAGRRTLSLVIGRGPAAVLIDLLVAGSFVLVARLLWAGMPGWSVIVSSGVIGLGVTGSIVALWGMHRRGYSHQTKRPNMVAIIRVVLLYTVSYVAVLALQIVAQGHRS